MTKPNDWMAINLLNSEINLSDLMANNINPNNTGLESYDYYKSLEEVQKKFVTESGEFDEDKYAQFYNSVLSSYNNFTELDYVKIIMDEIEVHPNDWMSPGAKVMDTRMTVKMIPDPYKRGLGQAGLWRIGEQPYSVRELAQAQKVIDHETGEELDWSPNDHSGLFKSLGDPTVVIATWDEDGVHVENGVKVKHYKGEYKLNKSGNFCYETLGDREAYEKDVLRYTDTLTVEGTWLNKYDIFDSDGLDKSVTGTIFRTALSIAPLFIPYVNYVYGMLGAGMAIAESAPTIFKSINSAINGSNNNGFGRTMTSWENYMYRFKDTESDYSRDNFMTFEKVGQQVAGIGLQLYQQKFLAKAPMFLGRVFNSKSLASAKAGQNLSLMFMAATSGADTYAILKNAGVNDRIAGIGTLATIAGFFTLMNNNYYKDILFSETSWLNENSLAVNTIRNKADEFVEVATKAAIGKAPSRITRRESENLFKAFFNTSKKGFKQLFKRPGEAAKNTAEEVVEKGSSAIKAGETHLSKNAAQSWWSIMLNRSTNEMLEEMGEEAMQDIIKAIIQGADSLGWNVRNDEATPVNFHFSPEDFLSRYLTAGIGGFVGGSIFEGLEQYEFMMSPQIRRLNDSTLSDGERLAYIIREQGVDSVLRIIDRLEKKGVFGNKHLSFKPKKYKGLDGKTTTIFESGTETDNQNVQIANLLRTHVNNIAQGLARFDMLWSNNKLHRHLMPQMLQEARDQIAKDSAEWKDDRIDREAEKLAEKKGGDAGEHRIDLYEQYGYSDTVITALNQAGFFTSVDDFYTKLGLDLVTLQQDYDNYEASFFPTDKAKRTPELEEKWKSDETRKQKEESIKKLIEVRDSLLKGDLTGMFVSKALMHANDDLLKAWDLNDNSEDDKKSYVARSVKNYTKSRYGINYDSLGDSAKEYFENEWKTLLNSDIHSKADAIYDMHVEMSKSLGKQISALSGTLYNKKQNKYFASSLNNAAVEITKLQVEIDDLNAQIAELVNQQKLIDQAIVPDLLSPKYQKSNALIRKLNLNDKIRIFENVDEFVKAITELGYLVPENQIPNGVFIDNVLYIVGDPDDSVVVKRILHEAVGHYGLKNLIEASGLTTLNKFMNNIYNRADQDIKDKINAFAESYKQQAIDIHLAKVASGEIISEEEVARALYTEEYLAHLAEKYSDDLLEESEKSFFEKVLDAFKAFFDLLTDSSVINDEQELVELLKISLNSLKTTNESFVPTIVPNFNFGESTFKKHTLFDPTLIEEAASKINTASLGTHSEVLKNILQNSNNFNSRQTISINSVQDLYNIAVGAVNSEIITSGIDTDFNANFILVSQTNLDFSDASPDVIIINGSKEISADLGKAISNDLGIDVLFVEDLGKSFTDESIFYRKYDGTSNTWIMDDPELNNAEESIKSYHNGSWIPNYKIKERLGMGTLVQFSNNLYGIEFGGTKFIYLYGNAEKEVIESELEILKQSGPIIVITPKDVEYTSSGLTLVGNGEFVAGDQIVSSKIYSSGVSNMELEVMFQIPIKSISLRNQESDDLRIRIDSITKLSNEILSREALLKKYVDNKMFMFGQGFTKEGAEFFNNFGEFATDEEYDDFYWLKDFGKSTSLNDILAEIATFETYISEIDNGMFYSDNYFYESWRNSVAERLIETFKNVIVKFVKTGKNWNSTTGFVTQIESDINSKFNELKNELIDQLEYSEIIRGSRIVDILSTEYWDQFGDELNTLLQEGSLTINETTPDNLIQPYTEINNDLQSLFEIYERISKMNTHITSSNLRLSSENEPSTNKWEPEIITLLRDFNTISGGTNSNYIEMIKRAYESFEGVQNLQEFSLNSTYDEIEFQQIMPVLKTLRALILGMYSTSTDNNVDFRSGFNEFANLYLSDKDKLPVLKNIDPRILLKQLDLLNSRIQFLTRLSMHNGSKKIGLNQQMAVDRLSDTYRKIEGFINVHSEKLSLNVDIPELWNESGELSYDVLTAPRVDQFEQIVKQGLVFEEALVKELLNSGWNSLSIDGKIDLLLEHCNNNLYCGNFGKKGGFPEISLTETVGVLYLLSMLEVSSADFNSRLSKAVVSAETKAPFDSQIFAIRIADAFIKSKFNKNSMFKRFLEKLPGDQRTVIKNAITIFGSAGTGKTTVVAKLIAEMNPESEVFGTAKYPPQREKLQKATGLDATRILDAQKLLDLVAEDRNEPKDGFSVNAEYVDGAAVLKSDFKLNLDADLLRKTFDPRKNNIVIVDELTLFSSVEWNILDQIADKYNITYVALGDAKQNSSKDICIKVDANTWWGDASDLKFLTVPTLTASFRSTNFAKDHNLKVIETGIQKSLDDFKSNDEWEDMPVMVADGSQPVVFDYLNSDQLYGDYITTSESDFKSILDKTVKLDLEPESKIYIIVQNDSDISKYNSYKSDIVKVTTIDQIQGNEGKFFFFDNTYQERKTGSHRELLLAKYKELYTMISRSEIGTVILDSKDIIHSELNIVSVEKQDSSRMTSSTASQYDDYSKEFAQIYGGTTPEPEEDLETSSVVPNNVKLENLRASLKFDENATYFKLDDVVETQIDLALDPVVANNVIKYNSTGNIADNRLNVHLSLSDKSVNSQKQISISFKWNSSSAQWVPVNEFGSIIPAWNNNYILSKLSEKLGISYKLDETIWPSANYNSSGVSEILNGLKLFVEAASVNKYKVRMESNQDTEEEISAAEYLRKWRLSENTFFVDDFNEYIKALPKEQKIGIFVSEVEENLRELNRAFQYISSVARDKVEMNYRIEEWINNHVKPEHRHSIITALTGEREFYFENKILYLVADNLKIPILQINNNTMFGEKSYYHGWLTKREDCKKVTTEGEGVYDNNDLATDYLITDPVIVAASGSTISSIINTRNAKWMSKNNGKAFILVTDTLYEDPKEAWSADSKWNHSWNPHGSVIGTQRIISISEIIRLSLLNGMLVHPNKFNLYQDAYSILFNEKIESENDANNKLNHYMGFDLKYTPVSPKLMGPGRRVAIANNYKILGTHQLLELKSYERLVHALISELAAQDEFVYNGLHQLIKDQTKVTRNKQKIGGFQFNVGSHRYALLMHRKTNIGYDQFKLFRMEQDSSGKWITSQQIGPDPIQGGDYIHKAEKMIQTNLESVHNISVDLDQMSIIPIVKTNDGINYISMPEIILSLLSDFNKLDLDKLNSDMLDKSKYPQFKRGLYLNLSADMGAYVDSNEFYKWYTIRQDSPIQLTNDIVKMIGSIYEGVGKNLIAGRINKSEEKTYFEIPAELKQSLKDKNLLNKVENIFAETVAEWLDKANEVLKTNDVYWTITDELSLKRKFDDSIFGENLKSVSNIEIDENKSSNNWIVGKCNEGFIIASKVGINWSSIIVLNESLNELNEVLSSVTQEDLDQSGINVPLESFIKEFTGFMTDSGYEPGVINRYLSGETDILHSLNSGIPDADSLSMMWALLDELKENIENINCNK